MSQLIRPLKHSTKSGFIPPVGAFDKVTMAGDKLKDVKGVKDKKGNTVSKFPSFFFIHPSIFLGHHLAGKLVGPAKLAVDIVSTCVQGYDNDNPPAKKKTTDAMA
jgi:hypothetical protein